MKANLPANEALRIELLHHLGILDTPREQRFDDIAQLARLTCDVPIAVVSLVDVNRQWFKSCLGLDVAETSRDVAFCAHAILQPQEMLVVEDALQDDRFKDNALVTGEPHIRFYAGVPLVMDTGLALGTLCVIDYVPRQLNERQKNMLALLANQVVQLLQLHQSGQQQMLLARHFEMLSNSSFLLIGQLDRGLRYLFCNNKYKEWFGIDPQEMLGKTPVEIFGVESAAAYEAKFHKGLAGESITFDVCTADDRTLSFDVVPVSMKGGNNQEVISSIFVIGRDVTHQQQQQQALEQERANLDAVIRGTNIGTWRWNVQTGETIFNERWADILGYRLEELQPVSIQTWLDNAHPDDLQESGRLLDLHFNGERDYYDYKCRMRHKEGYWVWVHDRGRVTTWTADGKPEWMSGTHADISHTEEAYAQIAQSERKLAALYNSAPVSIALNRFSDGMFLEANPEFYRMLGYTPEEFSGSSYWDITPRDYEAEEMEQLECLRISGRYGPYEKHYIHRSGHWISVLLNGVLIESAEGEPQIWSIIQDITERKRIEQMKNDFVSAVSHELRTPLTSITGSLGLVINGLLGDISPKAKDMLNVAHKNAQRLAVLINDLLDMEKLVAGKMDFELQPQLLLPIIEQSLEANLVYASHYGVAFALHSTTGAVMVNVDAQRIQQIMANFLSNAAKFSPSGGTVDIHIDTQDERVRISVMDHGPGIPDEFRARIFQKFSQADASSSRQRGGTGLGLAISKELVERMQGEIGFHSEPGQGATFFMSFPISHPLSLSSSNHNEGSKL